MSVAPGRDRRRIGAIVRAADERTGRVPLARRLLRYVFPEHWSFLWGEIALYCFVVLVVTGIYLAVFFDPSYQQVVYHGPYAPMRGQRMSAAYASALDLSLEGQGWPADAPDAPLGRQPVRRGDHDPHDAGVLHRARSASRASSPTGPGSPS